MRALDNVLDIDILVELSTDGRLRTTAGAGGFLQRCVECPNGECRCIPPDPPCRNGPFIVSSLIGSTYRATVGDDGRLEIAKVGMLCPANRELAAPGIALDRPFPLGDPLQLPLEVEITAGLSADLRLQLGVGFPDFGFSQICVQCPNGECRCIPPDPPCIDGFEPLKGMKSRFRIGTRVGLEAVGQICPRDFEVGSLGHPG